MSSACNRSPRGATCLSPCFVLAFACCEAQSHYPTEPAFELQRFSGPPGFVLDVACTPSGFERCFDAIDNNCNGAIDEGCGVRTGIVQFAIAWGDPTAGVDIEVTEPSGASSSTASAARGFRKDRQCGGANNDCQGQNTENVYWADDNPPRGKVSVRVRWTRLGDDQPPLSVRFGSRVGQRSYSSVLEFDEVGAERLLIFEL